MKNYQIIIDHHSNYLVKGMGKYGLVIVPTQRGATTSNIKMFPSDEELRGVLQKLGYNASEIADVFDVLADKKNHWIEHRDFDEAVVTELGF